MLSVAQKTPNITPNIDKILVQVMCEQYRQYTARYSQSLTFFLNSGRENECGRTTHNENL